MNRLEKLEKRWFELLKNPRKEDNEEILSLGRELELERALEYKAIKPELERIGINITSIWDLVNTKERYPKAVDVLIKFLLEVTQDGNVEGFARALTVREAKGKANKSLIEVYERTPKEKKHLRWAIGNAIATTMTIDDVPWVYAAAKDRSSGMGRSQLIRAIGTVRTEESENILIELLNDESVLLPVIQSLAKLKSKKSKEKLIMLTQSANKDVKKEALNALKKIG